MDAPSRSLPTLSLNWVMRLSQPIRAVPFSSQHSSAWVGTRAWLRSEEHTYELQSLMRISYAVFCLKKNKRWNYTIWGKVSWTLLQLPIFFTMAETIRQMCSSHADLL